MINLYFGKQPDSKHHISKHLHSVFFEYFGRVIYDGIFVGKESSIPNIDGLRRDVVEGCRELGIGAMRWPGGCCADHYHWKNGVGKERMPRLHPIPDPANPIWRNEFGTDEFLHFCELVGADPVLTINTATGTPEEFLDWFEYVNGPVETKYGAMRAANGHPVPYNVKYWGVGNTDENVWHIDFNNPVAYAQTYLKYQTVLRMLRKNLYFIGLGLSSRHKLPGWTGKALDHITRYGQASHPDALSIHHYLGGAKQGGEKCGGAVNFDDEGYYALLDLLERYQYDIDLHRTIIREHIGVDAKTKICFDEWGVWHPEATFANNQNQQQTLRDGIFAALTLHLFYRNSDIVEFAMETQLCNLLQSLFETSGGKCYRTPTYYAMKLLRDHLEQDLIKVLPDSDDDMLDAVASLSNDRCRLTISMVNKDLNSPRIIVLNLPQGKWKIIKSDIITAGDVHACNTFEEPGVICDRPFAVSDFQKIELPNKSIVRLVLEQV